MKLLEDDIKKTSPTICRVNPAYAEHLHDIDHRVSEKWSKRAYVGLAVRINNQIYIVPLTSQTTQKRIAKGRKHRSSQITTYIHANGIEIANLLHNNMFPVPKEEIYKIDIDPQKDTYLMNELRYIRKHWVEINNKSVDVFRKGVIRRPLTTVSLRKHVAISDYLKTHVKSGLRTSSLFGYTRLTSHP